MDLAIRSRCIDDDLLVVSADMMFNPKSFDLDGVLRFFCARQGELVCYYTLAAGEDASSRGIIEVDDHQQATAFFEKPSQGCTN